MGCWRARSDERGGHADSSALVSARRGLLCCGFSLPFSRVQTALEGQLPLF